MNPTRSTLAVLTFVTFLLALASTGAAAGLEQEFAHPPASARPWVYWFPLDGNITSNGITADLEAMQRVGIGGVLYMETEQGTPRGPADFGGPLWRALFKHACTEAARLGLEVNMNNDAGWCGSGGPWITPELSMQKIVWSETTLEGPHRAEVSLAQPAATANFYRDIAVLAFPTPTGTARISNVSAKAAFVPSAVSLVAPASYPEVAASETIARSRLLDLSSRCTADGRLSWDVPEGRWTILRLGYTTTGEKNHPAPTGGLGLECDKLSRQAVATHFNGLMKKLVEDVGPLAGSTLVSTHIDSWEVGSQNWTPLMRQEFQRRRGYDLLPLLPVVTGRVVESAEVSERFLWDLRQTISELVLDNYAGYFQQLAHQSGLRLSIEAYTTCPTDEMAYAGRADEPMGEFWSWSKYGAAFSCTEMASAAHVYGKRIVGAEAFTATDAEKWLGHPALIKDLGDWAFCEGINRFVFHRYALQPWADVKPGISMGPWGLHYERTQTWWEQSKAWHEYLARCQYLLQQGLFVADLCLMGPEGSPQTLSGQKSFLSGAKDHPDYPLERPGFNFDTCPPEVVLTRMSVKNGRLVLPDGMSYRALALPQAETMTPALLHKVKELVLAGATVVGSPPSRSPSLTDYPNCDRQVQQLATELWGDQHPDQEFAERSVGAGRIVWGRSGAEESSQQVQPRLGSAQWIWHNEGNPAVAAPVGKRYFRRAFSVDGAVESARLLMTADNTFECWINGRSAGAGDNFGRVYAMDVTPHLKTGRNLICVEAVNGADQPNPAGLIAALAVKYRDGRSAEIRTDGGWESAARVEPGWRDQIAQSGWSPAKELGPLGMAPWGDIEQPGGSPDIFPNVPRLCRWLEKSGAVADFSYETKSSTPALRYIHRQLDGMDVYFVANKEPQTEEALCSFRVAGKRPELWWPQSGQVQACAAYEQSKELTRLPIRLGPTESVFVVFREANGVAADPIASMSRNGEPVVKTTGPRLAEGVELRQTPNGAVEASVAQPGTYECKTTSGRSSRMEVAPLPPPLNLNTDWDLFFPARNGALQHVPLERLVSWTELTPTAAKYFSGTATYRKRVIVPAEYCAPGQRLYLDLGKVQVMAEVKLNGRDLGILWKPPFKAEITDAVRPGENDLEIRVVNLWINRMIGDEQLPEDSERNPNGTLKRWPQWVQEGKPSPTGRQTMTSWRLWKKDSPLQESGLIGPVAVSVVKVGQFRPVEQSSVSPSRSRTRPDVAAIYFPGFHQDQHYDSWFGEGWNEWRLLEQVKPRFAGQHLFSPAWGAFNEADPQWMARQIRLASEHGIDVFVFDWYWYSGVKILERPLEEGFLRASNRGQIKYALMWANHDWRNYFPAPADRDPTLWLPSRATPADFQRLIAHCITTHFGQPNYWRVNDGLFFGIFDPESFIRQLGGPEKATQ